MGSSPGRDPLSAIENRKFSEGSQVLPKHLSSDEAERASAESIPELLNTSLLAMPSQPAAEFLGTVLSRSELAARSDQLAAQLIANGAGYGALVGIYMERSIEMLVSVLGVLKAGAAYVPLDPKFPRPRIEQILAETRIPVLLTLARHLPDLHDANTLLICMDEEGVASSVSANPLPRISSEARAYVIFTSGSTGVPNGVEVSHGSVVNLLVSAQDILGLDPRDRLFAITTLAFDISVLELLLPLLSGGTVIIGSHDAAAGGSLLIEELAATQATVLQATPVTFRTLLEFGFVPSPGFKMLCGGEAWSTAMAEKLLVSGARLWNMYGPTETTVWSSITEVKSREPRLTIGPPIPNTRFYVVDEHLQPVSPGGHGELLIAGAGVALGYFQREALTAQKFLNGLQIPGERVLPEERVYRTGDEVRQLADGNLEFIGRLDQQIKLRGYRIELGEIEAAMIACPGVRYAVALARKNNSGEDFLIGFYTTEDDVTSVTTLLRESLSHRLPAYMVPRHFERLDAFPLTPNGKTDRRSLANYPLTRPSSEPTAGTPIDSSTEAELAQMFRKLFPGETIATDSDFFELGGDSLLLVMLQSMFSRKFGLRLDAVDITDHSTIGRLANWVKDKRAGVFGSDKIPDPDPRILPLQKLGADPPIFILPQMMYFRALAEKLGQEQPVYAIQVKDEDVPAAIDSPSMEDLARLYIGLIRKMQPFGPYRLGGWCLWGWMAYEVARLLEEQGEIVEVLVIIDAVAPGFWDGRSQGRLLMMRIIHFMHRIGWFLVRVARIGFSDRGKERLRRLRTFAVSLAFAVPRRWRPEAYVTEVIRIDQMASSASITYRPPAIQAKVLLFTSEARPTGRIMGNDMGWGKLLGRSVGLNFLPGNHNEIFHPDSASIMAEIVRKELGLESKADTYA